MKGGAVLRCTGEELTVIGEWDGMIMQSPMIKSAEIQ
jgi:hypothetical protein